MPTKFECHIHNAVPVVRSGGDSVWITVPLDQGQSYGPAVTIFLADTATVRAVGEALLAAAVRQERIAVITADTAA